jgi:signal transduction histidine kinase/CheY-like chemotaxis protein
VKAVLELASFEVFNPTHQAFLDQLTESIGIVLNTIEANMRTEDLLKQSQSLAEELQNRQQELQQTNQELQEKARLLAHQNTEVERKNQEVEQARQALEEKAEQLALTSKYKSEFLANMSHELRTPLNSLLILSDQLSKNPDGNLSGKQTDYAKTIHSSGNDLLMLINDILDLSKIESGTVVLDVGELRFSDLHNYVERTFRHVAEARGVEFLVELDPLLPRTLQTDSKRLQQIIKNLLSNAFKFTHHGRVALRVEMAYEGWHPDHDALNASDGAIAFTVSDTGIGIPSDKQQIIFEAFQQADGSTSRKYGGTGLGLAISRETARLLGGEIRLVSTPEVGSEFTLYLPPNYAPQKTARRVVASAVNAEPVRARTSVSTRDERSATVELTPPSTVEATDDAGDIQPDDRVVLIVDNDEGFADFALEIARKVGFKGLVTPSGVAAIARAREFQPHAILLDISLPDIDGWRVLKRLKRDLSVRHIPVYVVSTVDNPEHGLDLGARGVLRKPIQTADVLEEFLRGVRQFVERPRRRLLVVDSDTVRRRQMERLYADLDVELAAVESGAAAIEAMNAGEIDGVVLAPEPADMRLATLAEQLQSRAEATAPPMFLYVDAKEEHEGRPHLAHLAKEFNLRLVESLDALLDETSIVLCKPVTAMAEVQQRIIRERNGAPSILAGKKVLIVDDDIRNIFALTSVLERYEMVTVSAETGRDAINLLQASPDVDIVLMDIMMPEMDGIDTMKAIRQISRFKSLPIVAVTAKAMKGDREKCFEAGAWDYLAKPVDAEQMLASLRAWLAT